jgi:hypothetical protein
VTAHERKLLENVLDALDRLFDRQCSVIDLWALLFATTEALRATEHCDQLERTTAILLAIIRSGASEEMQRDRALIVTDELRHYLAGLLPIE